MKKTKQNKKSNKKDTHQAGKKGGKTTPIPSYEEYLEAYYLGEPIDDAKEKE